MPIPITPYYSEPAQKLVSISEALILSNEHCMSDGAIFEGINFLPDVLDARLIEQLLTAGATQVADIQGLHKSANLHIITTDYNSPICLLARNSSFVDHVLFCTPAWVTTSIAKGRLQDAKRYSPDPRQFFTGVCVSCSDLPEGDREAIYGGVMAMGGHYLDDFTKGTTHIIALTMESEKAKEGLMRLKQGVKVVLPHWIDDCLRLRRRISSEPYEFPSPKILQSNLATTAPLPTSQDSDHRFLCDSNLRIEDFPDTNEDVFQGKRIYLGPDLKLGNRAAQTVAAMLGATNAVLSKNVATADIYVGRWREGREYLTAARSNKIIGNYTWILCCIARGKYVAPRDHLLHYPIPREGLLDFRNDIITVSNYVGEARTYLERLIITLGATYTRNMKPQNTHLVTAVERGEKYNTAKAWGINCVNHLWLEESYARWQKLAVTESHFTTFPRETNLMDVIAQTPVLDDGILPFFKEDDTGDEEEAVDQHTQEKHRTSQPIERDLHDLESQDVDLPDIKDVRNFSSPLPNASGVKISDTSDRAADSSSAASKTDPKATKEMDSTPKQKLIRQDLAVETTMKAPETPTKHDQLLPTSRGSTARKASQAAASRLRDNMEDANKFGQQMRNKHKLPPLPSEAVPNKRLKSGIAGPQDIEKMQVVITGCPELTEALHNQCEALGITFISDARQATHVISPRMARTKKFIVAIPHTPLFVNWQWLLDTVKLKKLQPENKYPLEPALEAPWSQNLDFALILRRARKLQSTGGLFKNIVLLISDAVTKVGGFETYREIVEANGGTCGLVGRRGADTSNARVIMIADGKSDPAIKKYEKSFAKNGKRGKENKMAADGDGCEVYDREWLMLCAIRQEIIEDEKLKYL